MDENERKEIVEFGEKGPEFYDWKDKRRTSDEHYDFYEDYLGKFLGDGMRVLDMGCGDGTTLDRMSNTIKEGYGIELSEDHCEMARKKNEDNENITIVQQDVFEPFEVPGKFDLIINERGPISKENIGHVKKKLKSNGKIVAEQIGEQDERVFKEIMGKGQMYKKWEDTTVDNEFREMLEKNGLSEIKIQNHFYFEYYEDIVKLAKNHLAVPYFEIETTPEDLEKLETVEERLGQVRG